MSPTACRRESVVRHSRRRLLRRRARGHLPRTPRWHPTMRRYRAADRGPGRAAPPGRTGRRSADRRSSTVRSARRGQTAETRRAQALWRHPDIAHLGEHPIGRELIVPIRAPRRHPMRSEHRRFSSRPHFFDSYRNAALQRLRRRLGKPGDFDRVLDCACGSGVAVRYVDEGRELRAERLGEAIHEEVVRGALGKIVGGIDISDRRALVPSGDHVSWKP